MHSFMCRTYYSGRIKCVLFYSVGLADPSALVQAVSTYQACQFLGMPVCEVRHLLIPNTSTQTRYYQEAGHNSVKGWKIPVEVPYDVLMDLKQSLSYNSSWWMRNIMNITTFIYIQRMWKKKDWMNSRFIRQENRSPDERLSHVMKCIISVMFFTYC